LDYVTTYAPRDANNARIGGHVLGSTLARDDCYVAGPEAYEKLVTLIDTAELLSESTRVIILSVSPASLSHIYPSLLTQFFFWQIPIPGTRPFVIALHSVAKKETSFDVAHVLNQVRELGARVGLRILSTGADSASIERKAQSLTLRAPDFERLPDIKYTYAKYSINLVIPNFKRGGPLLAIPDPKHAAKSVRNFVMSGAKFSFFGDSQMTFAHFDLLLARPGSPLLTRDIHNCDRQDDGAALRLFHAKTLRSCTKDGKGEENHEDLKAVFIFLFVFGT
jgi:hypothetical protein